MPNAARRLISALGMAALLLAGQGAATVAQAQTPYLQLAAREPK